MSAAIDDEAKRRRQERNRRREAELAAAWDATHAPRPRRRDLLLTDAELTAIAAADPSESTASIARRLERPHSTVRRARLRLADPDGARAKLTAAKQRQRDRHQAAYQREIVANAARRAEQTAEERAAERAWHRGYLYQRNEASKREATNHREPWMRADDEHILATMADPAVDVALALGRSVAAVSKRRHLLRVRD
ncbi:MAG: hypothetical protein M3464_06075 [Chloroflexota bacterium]|nr:hypothetical protein [Chloroflexota bacterium]